MDKILITGGAGYVGTVLTEHLLNKGHKISVIDLMIYGEDVLKKNPNLRIIKGDIRDVDLLEKEIPMHDIVIHLACISNDPSFELDPKLGKSINLDAFKILVEISKRSLIKKFIYASSSSVYGLKNEKNIHENISLEPLTEYSKYKVECELILKKYESENFTTVTLRPATVCGYSPRQRLDVVVNILTNFAVNKKFIKVFGGDQLRPNLHIADYCEAVDLLILADKNKIKNEIFNVGYQNLSIMQIAEKVKKVVEKEFSSINNIKIEREKTDDIRSYHINSDKIKKILNFTPKYSIEDAILELCNAFKKKLLTNTFDDDFYFNVKRLQNIQAK